MYKGCFYLWPYSTTYKDSYKSPACTLIRPVTSHGTLRRENILPRDAKTYSSSSSIPYHSQSFNTFVNNLFKTITGSNIFSSMFYSGTIAKFRGKIMQEQCIDAEIDGWTLFHFVAFKFANKLLELDLEENEDYISCYILLLNNVDLILPLFKKMKANPYKQDNGHRNPCTFLNVEFDSKRRTFYNVYFHDELEKSKHKKNFQPTLHALCLTSYVGRLLQRGIDIPSLEWRDKFGRSAIFYCVFGMPHVSVINIKELVKIKASLVDEEDNFGKSPLYYIFLLGAHEELFSILCEISSDRTLTNALVNYLFDTYEFSTEHLKTHFKLTDPMYHIPYWARGQVGAGPKVQGTEILKILCKKYGIDAALPDSDIISKLFYKLSIEHKLTSNNKKKLMDSKLKEVFSYYARHVDTGCHEMLNAATTQAYSLKVALGEHSDMERTAKHKDGSKLTINNLIEKQRIKTYEYLMKPTKITCLPPRQKKYFKANENKYVFHGHIGAGYYRTSAGLKDLVTTAGASRGDMHTAQLKAMEESKHHLSLSRRLSMVTDKFQATGENFLKAYEDGGFHEDSYMCVNGDTPRNVTSSEKAYDLAVHAQFNLQKRKTKEKKIRQEYLESSSISEQNYNEIDSGDEVYSSDSFSNFKQKILSVDCFKKFKKKYNL